MPSISCHICASLIFCQWYLTCYPQYLPGRATELSSLLLSNPPPHTLLFFITHITILGLSHTTIKMYLSVVCIMHVATGQQAIYGSQRTPHLQQVLKGIKKIQASSLPPQIRSTITLDIMNSIFHLHLTKFPSSEKVMIWATFCIAFFGFFKVVSSPYLSKTTMIHQHTYLLTILLSSKAQTHPWIRLV